MASRRSPRRTAERATPPSPIDIHILDGAAALDKIDAGCLSAVVRALARHGRVVIASYDEANDAVRFHDQSEWIRGGLVLNAEAAGLRAQRGDHA